MKAFSRLMNWPYFTLALTTWRECMRLTQKLFSSSFFKCSRDILEYIFWTWICWIVRNPMFSHFHTCDGQRKPLNKPIWLERSYRINWAICFTNFNLVLCLCRSLRPSFEWILLMDSFLRLKNIKEQFNFFSYNEFEPKRFNTIKKKRQEMNFWKNDTVIRCNRLLSNLLSYYPYYTSKTLKQLHSQ